MSAENDFKIRNDQIRRAGNFGPGTDNPLLATPGVMALGDDAVAALFADIMTYENFDDADDPFGQHDFGVLEASGQTVWFKIDADPDQADKRIFTLLLPSEN